jgi:purine-binding chemotaxis protein CheW
LTESKANNTATGDLLLAARLGEELYAIPIECVEEILPALPIEGVPQCPSFVRGVVFVRGHLIPVISGAERLGIRNHQRPFEPHIVCLRIGDRLIGVEFDEAIDLVQLGDSPPLTANECGAEQGCLVCVVELDGVIIRLLDPKKLLGLEETAALSMIPKTGRDDG